MVEALKATYKDLRFEIQDILVDGDLVAYRWMVSGTDAEGKQKKNAGMSFYHLKDGKVVEDYFMSVPITEEQPVG